MSEEYSSLSIGVIGSESDNTRESEVGEPLILQTKGGPLSVTLHASPGHTSAVIWVYGAWGGLTGPANGIYPVLAEELLGHGISSLRSDFRNPKSLHESTLDVLSGVSFLRKSGYKKIALVGHSFGGAVVINAGSWDQEVMAVIAISSQTSGAQRASLLSPRPLLLIHGKDDRHLPPACSHTIYQWAGQPKQIILIPGASHELRQARIELHGLLSGWLVDKLTKTT